MAQFIATTKDNVKGLNAKQTVIIEVVTENGKKVKNIYLGNYKRRQDAYYLGMVENGMKAVRKGETTKEYRLLKLSKLLAEVAVKGYNTKTNYFTTETYNDEEPVKREAEAVEMTAEAVETIDDMSEETE